MNFPDSDGLSPPNLDSGVTTPLGSDREPAESSPQTDENGHHILPRDLPSRSVTYDFSDENSARQHNDRLLYQTLVQRPTAEQDGKQDGNPDGAVDHGAESDSRSPFDVTVPAGDAAREHAPQSSGQAPNPATISLGSPILSALNEDGQRQSNNVPPMPPTWTLLEADQFARSHALHTGLLQNPRTVRYSAEGQGAGINIRRGPDGISLDDEAVTSELSAICGKIQKLLDKRREYIELSLQRPGDNPRDDPNWPIYPPPPMPAWTDQFGNDSRKSINTPSTTGQHVPPTQTRKLGQDIGEDFNMEDLPPPPGPTSMIYKVDKGGIYQVYEDEEACVLQQPLVKLPSLRDFFIDFDLFTEVTSDGPVKSFAFKRLQYLEKHFELHDLSHQYQEIADTKRVPHRDFYNVRKVDTHIHHSACMTQKHLLRFIKSKLKKCPDEVVLYRDGKHLTLQEVFQSINLTAYDLSIDTLDMHAHTDSFHRFDKFNLKYNPVGESRLREIFLKTDNFVKGRYLADLTREVISDLEASKYQMAEWRISIYGRSIDEWDKLAAWVIDNKLFSPNVRWLVQIPRLYDVYKNTGMMQNFEHLLHNIFQPLFEVTRDPSKHPKLHIFLQRVVGFDSVDDESKPERRLYRKFPVPSEWNTKQNPPYSYWIYYMFANMASLNQFRKRRGFCTFLLRPHCGEAGDPDHLGATALCCHGISHGILLRKVPLLQYIFYLDQIGIAMSPLSNNALFLTFDKNPCASFFRKGLNVSLSTDDPLQFAFTREPLIEEYSVAAQIYKFSAVDMCELAKHSVEQSGFEDSLKRHWLGHDYEKPGVAGNKVEKCNVPDTRVRFRYDTLVAETTLIQSYASYQKQ